MKRMLSVLLCAVMLLSLLPMGAVDVSAATTAWVGSSSYGYIANHTSALNEVKTLMKQQTTAYNMDRFDLMLSEYKLSGYFNSYKTSPCSWHCGSCGKASSSCINSFYDSETKKTISLGGKQCMGYAYYASYRFFGKVLKVANGVAVPSTSLSSGSKVKEYLSKYSDLTGAHFRVNGFHSMVYLARDNKYIYFIDANAGYNAATGTKKGVCSNDNSHYSTCCKINLRRFTYDQFADKHSSVKICHPSVSSTSTVTVSNSASGHTNDITNTNAILWGRIDKPSKYAVEKIGIRVREKGTTWADGDSIKIAPTNGDYVGKTSLVMSWDMNGELNYTLKRNTTYEYQFYGKVNGKEYWSKLATFKTTNTDDHYKLTSPDGYQTVRKSASTSSDTAGTLYTNDIVCVTKYNSDKSWGYVTKGNVSGWIRLYYVEKTSSSHSYGSWKTTKAATCTAAGSKKRTCSCGKSETASITKLGHNYSTSWTVDKTATCTETGSKSHHCTRCSAKTDVTAISAVGHTYTDSKDIACNTCGYVRGIAVEITQQPVSVQAGNGETATVTVNALGDGLTYKWYYKNKGNSKFAHTPTFANNTYSMPMDATRSGRQVYCIITDAYGNQAQTNTITLGMTATITAQPKTATYAALGATAKATVKATGDGLKYQWYVKSNGATKYVKSSITTNTYSVKMSYASHNRRIYCVITDQYGNKVQTKTVILRMKTTVTKQPISVTVAKNKTAKVTVQATGDGLTYRWYFKDKGANKFSYTASFKGNTYSVPMTKARAGRQIYCTVTDKYGNKVKTNTVTLKMK